MVRQRNNTNDFLTREILSSLDQDIARGNAIPMDARYLEELKELVKDVTVNLEQRLPDDEPLDGK